MSAKNLQVHTVQNNGAYHRTDLEDIIQYEYFLIDEKEFIMLMTFVWYSEEKCSELHLKEVNSFNKVTKKWKHDKFSFKKLANFKNCKIKCGDLFYLKPFKAILSMLEKQLINGYDRSTGTAFFDATFREGCYDSYERLTHLLYDPIYAPSYLKKPKIPNFITWPVHYEPQRLAVPVSDTYSEYEKLLMPFDFFTWALIASTFVASFLTILVLYFVKRSFRDYIVGSNVTTPELNVIKIFFGISQDILPRRNFARYLTMLFILFCLIIRTAWQGKMYEFMQKDVMKPEVQTIEEMVEKNFTFYMQNLFAEKFPESEISRRGTIANNNNKKGFNTRKLFDFHQKVAFQTDLASEFETSKSSKGRFTKRIREEVIYIKMCGLVFPAHHYFVEMLDSLSQQLFTAGIVQHEYEDALRANIRAINLKYWIVEGPKVLNLQRLEPGFVIWLGSLTLTVIAFSLEWLKALKDFIVFKYILRAFFRMQHESAF